MKKLFIILIFIISTALYSFSQELPFIVDFSGFNGTNLNEVYPGWYEAAGTTPSGSSSGWYASDEIYDLAAGVSLNSNTHDEWIISPEFNATANTKISFEAAVTVAYNEPLDGFLGYDDSLSVMVSADGSPFSSVFTIKSDNQPGFEMQHFDVDLGQFAGQQIQVGFFATDGNMETGYCACHIDNITIKHASQEDAMAFELLSPSVNSCYSDNEAIVVAIKNDGYENIHSVPVKVKLRGDFIQNIYGVYDGMIEPGDTGVFQVGQIDMSATGDYSFNLQTELINDGCSFNDTLNNLLIKKPGVQPLPSLLLDFTDFYDNNLSEIYPGWHEARGEDFPTVAMNTDWQANNNLGDRAANVYFINIGTRDWIISPMYEATSSTTLTFDAGIEYDEGIQMGSDDKLAIMVSEDCGESWQEVYALDNSSGLSNSFQPFEVSLEDFDSQNIKIAFYATTGDEMDPEKFFIHIDNVKLENYYDEDAGVTALVTPANVCTFSNDEVITATVKNFGLNSISNFEIGYQVNGQAVVTETLTNSIAPGSSFDYAFNQHADLSGQNQHNISVWTFLSDDGDQTNDTLNTTVELSSFNLATDGTFTMGFEDDESFSNWAIDNANNDSKTWELNTDGQYAHNGVNSYWYSSNGTSVPSDDWLISPCFNLQAGETYYISFYYRNRATVYPEKLKLSLGSAQSGSGMTQILVDLGTIDNSTYLQADTTFTVSSSGEYYFGWHAYGDPDQFACHVDDIEIRQIFNNDLAVERIAIPRQYQTGSCALQNGDTAIVKVVNYGNTTETSIPMALRINNGAPITQTFSSSIAPGDSEEFILDDNIDIIPSESYDIKAWTELSSDLNYANDTTVMNDFVLNNYNTSFEPGEDLTGWTTENVSSPSEQWQLVDGADYANSGNYSYGIRTDQENNNDWLYSPCMRLEAGKCYSISFYYRSRYSTEYLDVHLGSSPAHAAMTDTLVVLDGFNSNSYLYEETQFSVDEDGDYYFGWHTHQGSSGRYWIYIDDVSIYENENSPSASFSYNILDKEVAFFSDSENITDFNWDFGDGANSTEENPFHTYQENGTYTVTLTASNGCGQVTNSDDVTIDCSISGDFTFTVDKNVVQFTSTSDGTGFLWDFDDGNYASDENPLHTFSEIGTYNVVFYPINVCGYDSIAHEVEITEIGIKDVSEQHIFVYPNPAKEKIMIKVPGKASTHISLYNAQGVLIKQKQSKSQTHVKEMSLKGLSKGVYFLVIKMNERVYHKKITKL